MKRYIFSALLIVTLLFIVACNSSNTSKTVVIGFTSSQTGNLNVSSIRQVNGLQLWVDQINATGGIKLSNGITIKFKSVFYDDESNTDRVQEFYTRLVTTDNADFLISPYSSDLTATAAIITEQYGKVMIATGAADDALYKKGYKRIFQVYTPASRYLTGAVDILTELDSTVTKIAFVYENTAFPTTVVEVAKAYAQEHGYEIVLFEGYDADTTDFSSIIEAIEAAGAEAVMGGGYFQDGSTLARQIYENKLTVKFMSLLVAPSNPDFADLGEAALGVTGPSQWEPLSTFIPDFGPTGAEFIESYKDAYSNEGSYHSAGGYAAGLILQKAIIEADSVDPEAVKTALDKMDMTTFYGNIQFDTSNEAHGLQIGHEMVHIQWQRDDFGILIKQVVWPSDVATAEPLYPKP